jgi:prepilin-type N-terminal cleavage/methylation domain-containing protein/prepilin-type processing-associated H-X9-DG protein
MEMGSITTLKFTIKQKTMKYSRNKQAFTLIELIVTVTIAVILLSLILPAIGRAREAGRRVACVNNLRQIYTAFACYLEDNNDKIFWGTPDMSRARQFCPYGDCVDWFLYGGRVSGNLFSYPDSDIFNASTWTNGTVTREMRPLNRYLDNKYEVFKCPSDTGRPGLLVSGKAVPLYEAVGNSYNFNVQGPNTAGSGGIAGYDISSIKTPSKTILFNCESAFPPGVSNARDWHVKGGGGDVCFVDGHVKFMVIETMNASGKDKYGTPYSWEP